MEQANLYDKILPEFPYALAIYEQISQMISAMARKRGKLSVVEYGAGTGLLSEQIASIDGIDLITVDPSEAFYEKARNRLAKFANVRVIKDDAIKFVNEKPADIIVSSFTYHHISDDIKQAFINSVANNLVDGGKCIIGDEFISDYKTLAEKTRSIRDFYKHTYKYLNTNGASQETLQAFNDSLNTSLNGIEEYKVSLEILNQHLKASGLNLVTVNAVWPKTETQWGCKIVLAKK